MYLHINKKLISFVLLLLFVTVSCPVALAAPSLPTARVWVEGDKSTASQRIDVQVCVSIDSEELRGKQLALSYHVYTSDGQLLAFEGDRIALENWADGNIMNIPIEILLSSVPGAFREKEVDIIFDIVNETDGNWFSTSPSIEFTADTVQYRGYFALKVRESIIRTFHHPVLMAMHFAFWGAIVCWSAIVLKRKRTPRFNGRWYGQFDPPVDKFIYKRYFRYKPLLEKGTFIECGAFDGETECSCKFFEETLKWHGVNVEPSPPIYEKLVKNRPDAINVHAALSDRAGVGEFHSVVHPVFGEMCTNGSLAHTEQHRAELESMGCSFKSYTVPVITYGELIERCHLRKCDLFVLGVEGNEMKVLASMKEYGKVLPKILVVGHGHLPQKDIIDMLETVGYKFDAESYINSFFVRLTWPERLVRRMKRL